MQLYNDDCSRRHERPGFLQDPVHLMRKLAARNEELARFEANPSIYPTENLLALMPRFDNCPTGRYMLSRSLPQVFSFENLSRCTNAWTTTEPKEKKRKINK